jgi:hypothetical protein
MFSAIGALIMLFTTYNLGREATKAEFEYDCMTDKKIQLAYSEYECKKKLRTLDWVKKEEK